TGEEQSKSTQVEPNFPDSRCIIGSPATWKVITVNGGNDNHEAFEPHTYIDKDTHEESKCNILSHLFDPEYLRRQYVTAHHKPVTPSIRRKKISTVFFECIPLISVLSVPRYK